MNKDGTGGNRDCVNAQSIALVLDLPEGHPTRRHVEECPRCNSIFLRYREFMLGEAVPGSDRADAEARLEKVLGEAIERPSAAAGAEVTGRTRFIDSLLRWWLPRPALVAAALAVIVAAVVWWQPWTEPTQVLRSTIPGARGPLEIVSLEVLDAGIRAAWEPMAGADSYEVRLYGFDLSEIVRLEPVRETTVVLHRDMLPAGAPRSVICRIAALAGGEEIGLSEPVELVIP